MLLKLYVTTLLLKHETVCGKFTEKEYDFITGLLTKDEIVGSKFSEKA